jgi:hypothetical protein
MKEFDEKIKIRFGIFRMPSSDDYELRCSCIYGDRAYFVSSYVSGVELLAWGDKRISNMLVRARQSRENLRSFMGEED